MLQAGADTTSDSAEWALSLLLNNPDKLKKARTEIDTYIGNSQLIQESDLTNLPYFNHVITETLRVYPAAPLLIPRESAEECVVSGYCIPRGTMLYVNVHAIHRDSKIWTDPEKFVPERFEHQKGEVSKILPFGMGRRKCPGEALGTRVVGLVLGTMIHCFEWERIGSEEVDMTECSGLTLPRSQPLEAMYRPRESMIDVLSSLLKFAVMEVAEELISQFTTCFLVPICVRQYDFLLNVTEIIQIDRELWCEVIAFGRANDVRLYILAGLLASKILHLTH